jgi:SNF2 family DNA or RNA helicase
MSYKIFHGASKENASTLCRYDVVLTTYDTVVSEASKSCKFPEVTTIHSIEWHRIVLDEGKMLSAHSIQNIVSDSEQPIIFEIAEQDATEKFPR